MYYTIRRDTEFNSVLGNAIGTAEHPFTGHFDGKGHRIRNINGNLE